MVKKLKHFSENDAVEWRNGEIVILVFEEMIFESSFYEEKHDFLKKKSFKNEMKRIILT